MFDRTSSRSDTTRRAWLYSLSGSWAYRDAPLARDRLPIDAGGVDTDPPDGPWSS
ncbi:MAG: hypothetical protein ABEH88_09315 [Halobacteriales archaeon]